MKVYCDACNRNTEYSIEPAPSRFGKVKGRYYEYDGQIARCAVCGREVSVPEVNIYNFKKLSEKVEEQKCLVKNIFG